MKACFSCVTCSCYRARSWLLFSVHVLLLLLLLLVRELTDSIGGCSVLADQRCLQIIVLNGFSASLRWTSRKMLCSNCSTSQSPRLRQLKQPLLLRPALRLVCCVRCKSVAAIWAECVTSSRQDVQQVWSSRFTAGRRHAATQAVLQQAAIAAVSCRSVARPIATCHAASGSTLDTPAINPSSSTAENESVLQDLLAWLVANGRIEVPNWLLCQYSSCSVIAYINYVMLKNAQSPVFHIDSCLMAQSPHTTA